MVLQKALSQHFKGIFESAKVPVEHLIESIVGSYVYCLNFPPKAGSLEWIKPALQALQTKNGMLVLIPTPQCPLKSEEGRVECFSLLKICSEYFLVNCPFVLTQPPKFLHPETREMQLLRPHYYNPSCTTLWLTTQQFFEYFS
jgi:hypothetical protein